MKSSAPDAANVMAWIFAVIALVVSAYAIFVYLRERKRQLDLSKTLATDMPSMTAIEERQENPVPELPSTTAQI